MIFEISENIQQLPEEKYKDFSRAVSVAIENHHFLDFNFQAFQWFESKFLDTDLYYGSIERDSLKVVLNQPPASLSRGLSHFRVGDDPVNDVDKMRLLVKTQAHIIVENDLYDGAALAKWVRLYRRDRNYKTVNEYVHRQMTSSLMVFSNGGGKENIPNKSDSLIQQFNGLHTYKLFSVFDSDRSSKLDSDKNIRVKDELNARVIGWHELENREVENYFPLATYQKSNLVTGPVAIGQTDEWDYYDLYTLDGLDFEKKDVLILSEKLTKDELKSRLEHKNSDPDEIQSIILKIAKIA